MEFGKRSSTVSEVKNEPTAAVLVDASVSAKHKRVVDLDEKFDWFAPSADDSKPMSWNEFINIHMKARAKDVAPKLQMKAIAARWRERDGSLKVKGQQFRPRILPSSAHGMFGLAGGKQAATTVAKPTKTVKFTTPAEEEPGDSTEDDAASSHASGERLPTEAAAVAVTKKRKQAVNHLRVFSETALSRKLSDGNDVSKFTIPVNKKTKRLFSKCLQEACDDIKIGALTPREALLRGATIPLEFLTR